METLKHTIDSLWQGVLVGLLLGAGLPAIFAFGLKALSVGDVAGDGVINRSEQGQPLVLNGSAESGSTITVVLNGVTYQTTTDNNGQWSVSVAPSTLQTLADGRYDLSVTATDAGAAGGVGWGERRAGARVPLRHHEQGGGGGGEVAVPGPGVGGGARDPGAGRPRGRRRRHDGVPTTPWTK